MFPKKGGKPPKWMVYNGSKPYEQMDDLGVPLFLETSIYPQTTHVFVHCSYGNSPPVRAKKIEVTARRFHVIPGLADGWDPKKSDHDAVETHVFQRFICIYI